MPEPVKIPVSMPLSKAQPMNETIPKTLRKRFVVYGHVHHVGYREEVQNVARALGLTGFVRNLRTGDIEVICEGDKSLLTRFQRSLVIKKNLINVHDAICTDTIIVKKRRKYFTIRYGSLQEELGEYLWPLKVKGKIEY
jgi:acylphosphatase